MLLHVQFPKCYVQIQILEELQPVVVVVAVVAVVDVAVFVVELTEPLET